MSAASSFGSAGRRSPRGANVFGVERRARGPVVVLTLIAVLVAYLIAVRITTNFLWFRSLSAQQVYTTRLLTGLVLFVIFGLVMAAAVAGTMILAHRLRPTVRPEATSSVLLRYRDLFDERSRLAVIVPALLLGLLAGLAGSSRTDQYLAWRHATSFGQRDPYFNLDISFYVFSYPWLRFVLGYLIVVVVVCLFVAALTHLANGALRALSPRLSGGRRDRRRPAAFDSPAQAHLSLLTAGLLLLYGLSNILDRYGYAVTNNARFTGIDYTADHARITGRLVVAIIAFLCAALFVVNAKVRRWPLAGTTVVVMLVSLIAVSGIYPALLQGLYVRPSEQTRQTSYVVNHLGATRQAYGVAGTQIEEYSAVTTATAGQLKQDAETLPAIRLMDPAVIGATFQQRQQVRGYYTFPTDLDVDRYQINGQSTDAVVAAREINVANIADKSWNNIHTVYTHGYGLVAAYGNQRESDGEPVWMTGDQATSGVIKQTQPRIYFGEQTTQYAVVGAAEGSEPVELDLPTSGDAGAELKTTYTGRGGVAIGNPIVRLFYATRFADANLLLSNRVNENSKVLYDRQPSQRVKQIAPWLTVDQDPYPAVVNGRVVWIVDGYTTSDSYPNAQRIDLATQTEDSSTAGAQTPNTINYIRNSVKAVVDAYDGSVTLYAWDEADPILSTWMKVYPGLVQPKSAISAELTQHLRYPQDLFKVQRAILGAYHTTNPLTWMQSSDLWKVPADPVKAGNKAEPPYYLTIRWPKDDQAVFSQTTLFVPNGRDNLRAYLSVNADASSADYGKLRILRMTDDHQISGPSQTMNAITTNTSVAEKLRPFLNQGSASVVYGNLMTLPMGGGLLYVQPIYTMRTTGTEGYPILRFVVVRFGEHVGIGDTLQQALDQVFGGDAGGDTGESKPGQTQTPGQGSNATVVKLLGEAQEAFVAADKALKAGNLSEYQKQIAVAEQKVDAAVKAAK